MKRRGFLTRLFGGATVAAGAMVLPKAQEAVAKVAQIAMQPPVALEVPKEVHGGDFEIADMCSCSATAYYDCVTCTLPAGKTAWIIR